MHSDRTLTVEEQQSKHQLICCNKLILTKQKKNRLLNYHNQHFKLQLFGQQNFKKKEPKRTEKILNGKMFAFTSIFYFCSSKSLLLHLLINHDFRNCTTARHLDNNIHWLWRDNCDCNKFSLALLLTIQKLCKAVGYPKITHWNF